MSNTEAAIKIVDLFARFSRVAILESDANEYSEAVSVACAALIHTEEEKC